MAPLIALLLAAETVLAGDAHNARGLYRLHCAACHGEAGEATELGKSLGAPLLKDPTLIAGRSDDQLLALMLRGTPAHPAPGTALSLLDAADLLAYLRAGLPSIAELFPDSAAYTVKSYTLQGPALTRAEALVDGELKPDERTLTVFSVYGGDPPAVGPRLVPQDPVQLDELQPKAKRGYAVFGWLGGAPVAMGLSTDFAVARLLSPNAAVAQAAPAVVGKGSREAGRRKPFVSKAAPEAAKALTRLYARAAEAAAMAAKEEADRHLFDVPDKK